MIERNSFIKIKDVIQPSPSPRFSITKSEEPVIAPKVGENNNEILKKLGYTDKEIQELKDLN
jgi:crotonobetainyl-CoA:carnitine CoA-transferase CaiB-like acyl-CoA transferase